MRLPYLLVAALLAMATAACLTPRSPDTDALVTPVGTFRIEFAEWDEPTSELLKQQLLVAAQVLSRWGGLTEPVRITVVNSHWELEEIVGRKLPGISAWARARDVFLWNPRWWPLPPGVQEHPALAAQIRRTQVTDLLKHELTHCLMFQRAGPAPSDTRDRIPFWFREGMATVTAGEGAQWPSPATLAQWLEAHPGFDLLRDVQTIARTDRAIAYGAAYHGFDFFVRRYGDAAVLRVLEQMGVRAGFPEAFRDAVGVPDGSFRTDFLRYVSWRAFQPAAATRSGSGELAAAPSAPSRTSSTTRADTALAFSARRPAAEARSPDSAGAAAGHAPRPPAAARSP